MKVAAVVVAPAAGTVAGAAALLLLLGGCSAGARGSVSAAATRDAATSTASTSATATSTAPTSAARMTAATSATSAAPSGTAGASIGWAVIQPTASVAPAAEQAASAAAADPSARAYPTSSTDAVYSIAGVGVSGSVEYVDAFSVRFVCGAGIPDDCDRFIGTPEYRIPLADGARFVLLGTDMRPNRPADFAEFRQYAAGTDGRFDGNYDLFELALNGGHEATSLTAVYTP